jgi:ATP-binding cassette subfamily B protein
MLSNIQGSISGAVSTIGNLIMTYVGVNLVMSGDITLGTMMAFTTMSGYFMDPVSRLVGLQVDIQEANISMKRISEILDYETEQKEVKGRTIKELECVNGDIEINNVTFRYGNRHPALENISISIPKGKKVALVGGSGSGKSTIAKLLLKYYEPEQGDIRINGLKVEEYSNSSLRKAISYMPQNIELFSKTIFDNIRVSKMDATYEEVEEAAKLAGADEFIKRLPLEYLTYLEEAGNGLSGGEKQRIALARAFLKKNNFYILDESTSNLDFATENLIFDMIYNKFSDKSMLIIAHRLATVKLCDEIIVMDKGHIVERGTHEELLRKQGKYYDMWQLQQGNFSLEKKSESKFTLEDRISPINNTLLVGRGL